MKIKLRTSILIFKVLLAIFTILIVLTAVCRSKAFGIASIVILILVWIARVHLVKCSNCGAPLPLMPGDDLRYCPKCSKEIDIEQYID